MPPPTEKRDRKPHKKVCNFCVEKVHFIDYKEVSRLRRFVSERGKILPRRVTGTCARHQRRLPPPPPPAPPPPPRARAPATSRCSPTPPTSAKRSPPTGTDGAASQDFLISRRILRCSCVSRASRSCSRPGSSCLRPCQRLGQRLRSLRSLRPPL